jgi:hypothetical protein
MLVGTLALAFVGLVVVYRFTAVPQHSIVEIREGGAVEVRVDDPASGGHVSVSPSGVSVKTGEGRHVSVSPRGASAKMAEGRRGSVSPNGVSVQSQPPAAASSAPKGENASVTAGVFRAVKQAFIAAARSVIGKSESAAQDPPSPPTDAPSARTSSTASQSNLTAEKAPDWVDHPPQPRADRYEMVVKAGPWKTRPECDRELDEKLAWAVDSYVAWRIGDEAATQVQLPEEYARENLVKEQWIEKINTSLGEMYNLYALLSFDGRVEGKVQDTWNQIVLGARLLVAAAILGGVLLILTVIYGYLKIDIATQGSYRGRLRFLAGAAILALATVGVALLRRAPGP